MNIRVMPGIVAVKPTEVKSGLIDVVNEKGERPEVGEVVEDVHPGYFENGKERPVLNISKGDVIAYRRFGESKFLFGTDEVIFVDIRDVLGVIEK